LFEQIFPAQLEKIEQQLVQHLQSGKNNTFRTKTGQKMIKEVVILAYQISYKVI